MFHEMYLEMFFLSENYFWKNTKIHFYQMFSELLHKWIELDLYSEVAHGSSMLQESFDSSNLKGLFYPLKVI